MVKVAVIDHGMGNLHSVAKALETAVPGTEVAVTADPQRIRAADRVVLPGVGAIRDVMSEINRLQLHELIHEVIKTHPFLAVCVGLQALMTHSDENNGIDCLDVFSGGVHAFASPLYDPLSDERLKVPHMGWNQVTQSMSHPLWKDIPQDSRFYFVHSYYVQPESPEPIAAYSNYGHAFAAALARDNVFAVQFHPEKSHNLGLRLYANFIQWDGQS